MGTGIFLGLTKYRKQSNISFATTKEIRRLVAGTRDFVTSPNIYEIAMSILNFKYTRYDTLNGVFTHSIYQCPTRNDHIPGSTHFQMDFHNNLGT